MISKEDLIRLSKNAKEDYSGCSSMFLDDGKFNKFNWGGGDDVIRQFGWKLEYGETYAKDFDLELDNHEYSGKLVASKHWSNDKTYIMLCVEWIEWLDEDTESPETVDTYVVRYYKERGHTELVNKNGRPINFNEYVRLLQIIEATGYKLKY